MEHIGKSPRIGRDLGRRMRRAGFTHIDDNSGTPYVFPMCGWPDGNVSVFRTCFALTQEVKSKN